MGDYNIETSYNPGYASFTPDMTEEPYLGKQGLISAGEMGMTTDPRSANQLKAISDALNPGAIPVEMGTMDVKTMDSIPKQHFQEMKRLAKLTGSKISMHAPIQGTDPAGIGVTGQQGAPWRETDREWVEQQLVETIDRAAQLGDKDFNKNLPVTIHGSNTSGSTFKYETNPQTGKREKVYDQMIAINRKTGQLVPVEKSTMWAPEITPEKFSQGEVMIPEDALKSQNSTQWRKDVDAVIFEKEKADELLRNVYPVAKDLYHATQQKPELFSQLPTQQKEMVHQVQTANAHIHQAHLSLNSVFSDAYEYGNDENKKKISELNKEYRNLLGIDVLQQSKEGKKFSEEQLIQANNKYHDLQNQSFATQVIAEKLRKLNPNMFQTVEEFGVEKGSETLSNVALHSYQKYGDRAPVVSIENLYQGMGFSQAQDLKNLVETTQEKFIDKAIKKGISKGQAQEQAKKLIGVTFDVGHLNLSRKHGFKEEDLVKEAKLIKEHIKHVHLTDNFGNYDTHLPLGMGNVPVKELIEAIGEEGQKARKINEVGGWFEHFKTNPFLESLQAVGSPIYSNGNGPYWSQSTGFQQSYSEGYGMMLPSTHYQMFGAGFSQLPQELGGSATQQGAGGRMGGGQV